MGVGGGVGVGVEVEEGVGRTGYKAPPYIFFYYIDHITLDSVEAGVVAIAT